MDYRRVDDISVYVQELLDKGAVILKAEKFGRILARKGQPGEKIITWSVDAEGQPLMEKEAVVGVDAETGKADMVVIKADENGTALTDKNGNINEWIITDKVFTKKYEEDTKRPGLYKPVGGVQKFVKLTESIVLQQWGSEMNIDAGGYVNITNPSDIYGISGRDFQETYKIID